MSGRLETMSIDRLFKIVRDDFASTPKAREIAMQEILRRFENKKSEPEEMKDFMRWFELEHCSLPVKLTEKQRDVLKAFFSLGTGEGKTFLIKALLEFEYSDGKSRNSKFTMAEILNLGCVVKGVK